MFFEKYDTIRSALREATGLEDVLLVDGGDHADLASTVAFALAKERRKAPALIAQDLAGEIAGKIAPAGITVETAGPYLNFKFDTAYCSAVLKQAVVPGYGQLPLQQERVILEHTSANPNGPLHVGHIRNTILGDTLSRCFRSLYMAFR